MDEVPIPREVDAELAVDALALEEDTNEIAAKLGEVGLPAPLAELAATHWHAVVVGGGHNGLTAAAYRAR